MARQGDVAIAPDPRPVVAGPRRVTTKSRRTREQILVAAQEVAAARGLANASVSEIAEEAGVALGNLYYHFRSREELLLAVTGRLVRLMSREVVNAVRDLDGFFAKEEAGFRAYISFVKRYPGYAQLAHEVRFIFPEENREVMERWVSAIADSFRGGIATGELGPMTEPEIDSCVHLLLGTRQYIDQLLAGLTGSSWPGDEVMVGTYMKMLRSGIEAP